MPSATLLGQALISGVLAGGMYGLLALGLSLIWGYGGSLSFGQTAFFGVAGYSYGILTINFFICSFVCNK